METILVKNLYKAFIDTEPEYGFILPPEGSVEYPEIEGNESNFIDDYNDSYEYLDKYFINHFGNRTYEPVYEPDDMNEMLTDWFEDITGVLLVHLESWARLYYALNEQYNPLYNVDGTTEITYSKREDKNEYGATSATDSFGARSLTDAYGAVSKTDIIGSQEITNGARSDTRTEYQVGFDSGTEKETGKSIDSIGQQTITEGSHTDTHSELARSDTHSELARSDTHSALAHTDNLTVGQHTETTNRYGNIGVTKSTELLESEWTFRKQAFFKWIFEEISKEVGLYYGF